jgi:hypothetical protein
MLYTVIAMVQIVRHQNAKNSTMFLTWQRRRLMGQGTTFSFCLLPFVYPLLTENRFIWRTQ